MARRDLFLAPVLEAAFIVILAVVGLGEPYAFGVCQSRPYSL